MKRLAAALCTIGIVLLAACSSPPSENAIQTAIALTQVAEEQTEDSSAIEVAPIDTPEPKPTASPTATVNPTATPRPTRTPKPTATATPEGPEYGTSDNPYYLGERAVLTRRGLVFDVGLVDVMRGADALAFVQEANQFNDPPPEGMEFAVAEVLVRYLGEDEGLLALDEDDWSIVTKGRIFGRWDKPEDPCCLMPEVDFLLFPGGRGSGYMAWPVYEDDPNPMLAFALSSDAKTGWFFSLQAAPENDEPRPTPIPDSENAYVPPATAELGERSNPYPIGEVAPLVKGGDLEMEVSLTQVLRGADAYAFVKQANQFNDPPLEGMEYIVVETLVRYTGSDAGLLELDEDIWRVVTQGRAFGRFDRPTDVCCLEPPFEFSLLPGGEASGYMAWPVYEDDPEPLLVFALTEDGDQGWFFALFE